MARFTHQVIYSDLGCWLNLMNIAETSFDIEYHSLPFERFLVETQENRLKRSTIHQEVMEEIETLMNEYITDLSRL